MENQPVVQSETNDRKDISVLIAVGVIVIVCICCLLSVAGYALYTDLSLSGFSKTTPTAETSPDNFKPEPTAVSFKESFSSNQNEWTEGNYEDEYGTIDYKIDGTYDWDVIAAIGVNQKSWANTAPVVEDFSVTVEATHTSGAENASYGLIYRIVDSDNLYFFSISDVGYYYVGVLNNGEWITLIDWTETSLIKVGSMNELMVIGEGDTYRFFINGDEVDSISDGTFQSGTAGLAIELYESGDTSTFEFDNFILNSP